MCALFVTSTQVTLIGDIIHDRVPRASSLASACSYCSTLKCAYAAKYLLLCIVAFPRCTFVTARLTAKTMVMYCFSQFRPVFSCQAELSSCHVWWGVLVLQNFRMMKQLKASTFIPLPWLQSAVIAIKVKTASLLLVLSITCHRLPCHCHRPFSAASNLFPLFLVAVDWCCSQCQCHRSAIGHVQHLPLSAMPLPPTFFLEVGNDLSLRHWLRVQVQCIFVSYPILKLFTG